MNFYRIEATIANQMEENTKKNQEAIMYQEKSEMFFQQCNHNFFFFIIRIRESKIVLGCIAKETNGFEKTLSSFFNILELEVVNQHYEEISLNAIESLLNASSKRDYIRDTDDILRQFNLLNLISTRYDFKEYFVDSKATKKINFKRAKKLLCENTLVPELERIYMGSVKQSFQGNPVHYIIQTDNATIREEIIKILLSALYCNKRISSKRYCSTCCKDDFDDPSQYIDELYESCFGTAVVIDCSVSDGEESEYAKVGTDVMDKMCNTIDKYKNNVLTILCVSKNYEKMNNMFFEHLKNITFVQIGEEMVNGEKAIEYLKHRAEIYNVKMDDELINDIKQSKCTYLCHELNSKFDNWYSEYLKKEVYPQYSNLIDSNQLHQKEEQKGDAYMTLQNMIGLKSAKEAINQVLDYHKAQRLFESYGMKANNSSKHMIFTGNPGTAKTTVARLFAQIMKDNGILSKGDLYEVGRSDLVGKYVGWTAKTVKQKFNRAKGSVLFIDEAYSLLDDKEGMYGDEAINTIVQEMENNRDDMIVIFAGYPKEMEKFLERNPGLNSRIAFHIHFDDYTPEELYKISEFIAKDKGVHFDNEVRNVLLPLFESVSCKSDFGNGRYARNIIEKAQMQQARRLIQMNSNEVSYDNVSQLIAEDFQFAETFYRKEEIEKRVIGFSM